MQNAQSTLPTTICKAHRIWMSSGTTHLIYLVSFEESFNAAAPVVCVCLNVFTLCQGWDAYGYSCYLMEETPRTWSEAKAFCKAQDGFMLHIGDMYVWLFKQQRCVRTTCAAGFSWLLSMMFPFRDLSYNLKKTFIL